MEENNCEGAQFIIEDSDSEVLDAVPDSKLLADGDIPETTDVVNGQSAEKLDENGEEETSPDATQLRSLPNALDSASCPGPFSEEAFRGLKASVVENGIEKEMQLYNVKQTAGARVLVGVLTNDDCVDATLHQAIDRYRAALHSKLGVSNSIDENEKKTAENFQEALVRSKADEDIQAKMPDLTNSFDATNIPCQLLRPR
jgi:nicotinamidase-related amidase